MPVILSPNAKQQFFTDGSTVAAGYKLYTYAANTNDPQATFMDRAGSVANSNPIVLDARGEATIYLTPGVVYDYVLKTDQDALVWTREDVLADAGDANAVTFTQAGSGAIERSMQDKGREALSARDFGALGDGIADDTAAINLAATAAEAAGQKLKLGRGTFVVSSITGLDNVEIEGEGPESTILRRKASAVGNSPTIDFTGRTNFTLRGLTVDGNKANQTNGASGASLVGCQSYTIENCVFRDCKSVGGGYGEGLVVSNGLNDTNLNMSMIRGCRFLDNEGNGLYVNNEWHLAISDNLARGNGKGGISLENLVFPPVANSQSSITVSGNISTNNSGSGIGVRGFYVGGSISAPVYGPDTASTFITITGNVCKFNTVYGIAYQGAFGTVTGNTCASNSGSGISAGILFNGFASSCTGNTTFGNEVYGIDAGASTNCTITGNTCYSDGDIGINLGATINTLCASNNITLTGSDVDIGITMSSIDGDGSTPFPQTCSGTRIIGNTITLNSNSASAGISISGDCQGAVVHDNAVFGATDPNQAYQLASDLIDIRGNTDNFTNTFVGSNFSQAASAATLVVPDWVEKAYVTGAVGISSMRTYSQNVYAGKVRAIRMSSMGTGYSRSTPPTVSITGGGGAGATATAEVDNGGRLVGFTMTNNGSGYTSAPAVNITHNGGSGAAGTALVGCVNADAREITLFFQGALTVTDSATLDLNGNFVTTANKSILKVIGSFGNFYEVSRVTV